MKYLQKKIIDKAIAVFQTITGLNVDFQIYENDREDYPDALMRVAHMDLELFFAVAVKPRITRAVAGLAVQELFKYNEKGLLVTRYLTPHIADLLKEYRSEAKYIFVGGDRYEHSNAPSGVPTTYFHTSGSLVQTKRIHSG